MFPLIPIGLVRASESISPWGKPEAVTVPNTNISALLAGLLVKVSTVESIEKLVPGNWITPSTYTNTLLDVPKLVPKVKEEVAPSPVNANLLWLLFNGVWDKTSPVPESFTTKTLPLFVETYT